MKFTTLVAAFVVAELIVILVKALIPVLGLLGVYMWFISLL